MTSEPDAVEPDAVEPDAVEPDADAWGPVDMAAIWEASRSILETQVGVVERAVVAGIERRPDLDHQREAGREAHKLAGSLGTFGFDEGSRLARTLELALSPSELLDQRRAFELAQVVLDLQAAMARPVPQTSTTANTIDPGPSPGPGVGPGGGAAAGTAGTGDHAAGHGLRVVPGWAVLVVDGDGDRARRLVEVAAGHGLRVAAAATLAAARTMIAAAPPDAVVVDAGVGEPGPGPGDRVDDFLAELAARRPPVATVVLADRAGLGERVQAARWGPGR